MAIGFASLFRPNGRISGSQQILPQQSRLADHHRLHRAGRHRFACHKTEAVALLCNGTQSLSSDSVSMPISQNTAEVRRRVDFRFVPNYTAEAVARDNRLRRGSATKFTQQQPVRRQSGEGNSSSPGRVRATARGEPDRPNLGRCDHGRTRYENTA